MSSSQISIPAAGLQFWVNNRNRTNIHEPAFRFQFPSFNMNSCASQQYYAIIDQVILRNFIPTIQAGVNDRISYKYNGNTYTAIFAQANYDVYDLLQVLETEFKARDPGFAMAYDSTQMKLSLTIPETATSFSILRPILPVTAGVNQDQYTFPSPYDRFLEMCGWFNKQGDQHFTGPFTYVGADPVQLGGTAFLDINVTVEANAINTSKRQMQTIGRVYVNGNYGDTICHQASMPIPFPIDCCVIQSMRIYITDEWNNDVTDIPGSTLFAMRMTLISVE